MSIKLTDIEEKLILSLREEKDRRDKQEEEELKNKNDKIDDLEEKFNIALAESSIKINKIFKKINKDLNKAIDIAEEYGVPLRCDLDCLPKVRKYFPDSIYEKWNLDDNEGFKTFLYEEGMLPSDSDDLGWEYWNTSSMNC